MKQFKFKSIRTRLTYWFLILSLLPLFIGILITFNQEKQAKEQETFDKLTAIRDLKVQQVQNWIDEKESWMKSVSEDKEFRDLERFFQKKEFDESDYQTIENMQRILKRHLANFEDFYELSIINKYSREVLVSTNKDNEGINETQDPSLAEFLATEDYYIKDIHECSFHDTPTMAFSIPIRCIQHNGIHIIGILVARTQLEESLYALLSNRIGLGETGETLIVNKDVVALNELRWYDNAPLNLKISAEPAFNASQGKTGITVTKDYRGEDILAAYTYMPETGWGFVAKQDLHELNAPIRALVKKFAILLIISTILIVLMVFWISKKISKPIIEMNYVAQKVGAGDLSVRNSIISKDELGSLARAFNETISSIESHNATQKGVADISDTMIVQSSMQEFGSELLKQLMEITKSNMGTFYILNEASLEFEHFTSVGANEELLKSFSAENPEGEFGYAISKKKTFYLRNIPDDTVFKFRTTAGDAIPKEIITIPILIDNTVVALISLVNIHKFSKECYDILKQSWNGINISYSNLIAGERIRVFAEHLSRSNQELEAQTEELQDQAEELQDQTEELQKSSEELQEQNLELEQQRKHVEEANRLKSEFLSNMSHELRTPLNSIMALSRVLIMQAKDKLSDDENNYLDIVERNGKQLLSLINDILDLSKIEAGKMDIHPEFISLAYILNIIKENMQSMADEKSLAINLQIPENLPKVETDETRLYQVILNIVSNAVKFTKEGSVDISVNNDQENIYIEVKDTGIGISAEDIPHIFDEFRQVDGSSSRQFEGTGLGLAIASKMIKILGGKIDVKSKLGEGSIFRISLPIIWYEKIEFPQGLKLKDVISQAESNTILVVDDNPEVVKGISKYLEESGYKTISATSGKEALKLAEEYQPFAITLDVLMPEMDGWEVLQKLKSMPGTKDIPVVIVSVSDDKETGFALGANGYIQKPVNKQVLMSEIYKLIKIPDLVMIVDDNKIDLEQMSEHIKAERINTILAGGGKECIELLKKQIPDVLVLDLLMPEINGFMVLEQVRKNHKTRNLPVIIVTAKDLTKKDKERLSGNISSILSKSDTIPHELFKEVKRILNEIEKSRKITKKPNSKTRILIVEDNEAAIIQVKTILGNEGYIVDVAKGGREALEYMKDVIPDGIILDLMMPDVDGFEVLEKIRNTERTMKIPVLILTAKDLTKDDLKKLSSNYIQQLLIKGDIDKNGLLFKVKLMLVNEPRQMTKKIEIIKEENGENLIKRKGEKERLREGVKERLREGENGRLREGEKERLREGEKERLKEGEIGRKNVLIVEDNPDNMTTIKAILQGKFNISEAVDGEQGLRMTKLLKPDIVLLDMALPKMDGVEVVQILKSYEETKYIPVIALTARAMKEDKEKFLKAGCDGYIAKPIDPEELLEEIVKLIKK